MDMWIGPLGQPVPFGTCAQADGQHLRVNHKLAHTHRLPTHITTGPRGVDE